MMRYFGTAMGTVLMFGGALLIYLDYAMRPLQVQIEELRKRTAEIEERTVIFKKEHGLK